MTHESIMVDVMGFMKSRIIITAAELDLFTAVEKMPSAAAELSGRLGLDVRATNRLLDCLVTFGLLEKEGGCYRNTEKGAHFSSRHRETLLPMVLHMSHLWNSWSGLTNIVRKGPAMEPDPGLRFDEMDWRAFIGAMHVTARSLSTEIANDYDASRFKRLLDVGGACGTYTIAFLRKNPSLRAVIFDLKEVIPMAEEAVREEGFQDRVELVAGDFYEEELPKGCDLALLSAIIHQNSPEENLQLFEKVRDALAPGGTILIRDHIMEESRTMPGAGAVFAINMLVNTHGGDTYAFSEVRDTLGAAGFVDVRLVRKGEKMDCLVDARKPMTGP
jgi:precorrin-6B methylase 2